MQWSHSAAQQAQGRVWAPAHHHAQAEREVELAALQDDHRLVVQPHALACGEEERGEVETGGTGLATGGRRGQP